MEMRVRVGPGSCWITVALYVVLSLTVIFSDAESARKKDREVSGLYPFPRVGRRDNFDAAISEFIKRQGLIPFPRVGRAKIKSKLDGIENENWNRLQQPLLPDKPNKWALIPVQVSPIQIPPNAGKDEGRSSDLPNIDSNESIIAPGQTMSW